MLVSSQEAGDGQRSTQDAALRGLCRRLGVERCRVDDAEEIGRGGFGIVFRCKQIGIAGEAVEPLSPLPCPDTYSEATGLGPGDDAVALFAERAAAAVPGFVLTTENMATITQICSRLDGLPLAIELAAARLRAMSPEQVLDRLADRFMLLTRGSRRAPTRQQTLAWSIGWSYDLCTPDEQQLWGRLSVFSGSFELQAAEEICDDHMAAGAFLDLVSSLVDKSILLRSEEHGMVRLRLLETV
jgi:predicted ATPase